MKIITILIFTLFSPTEKYIIINDILYRMSEKVVTQIKQNYNIKEKDVTIFKFSQDSCYASTVEWINISSLSEDMKNTWSIFRVRL